MLVVQCPADARSILRLTTSHCDVTSEAGGSEESYVADKYACQMVSQHFWEVDTAQTEVRIKISTRCNSGPARHWPRT
jgi:hypothetical protein